MHFDHDPAHKAYRKAINDAAEAAREGTHAEQRATTKKLEEAVVALRASINESVGLNAKRLVREQIFKLDRDAEAGIPGRPRHLQDWRLPPEKPEKPKMSKAREKAEEYFRALTKKRDQGQGQ